MMRNPQNNGPPAHNSIWGNLHSLGRGDYPKPTAMMLARKFCTPRPVHGLAYASMVNKSQPVIALNLGLGLGVKDLRL